jgi:two-component system OmpR family response regulator
VSGHPRGGEQIVPNQDKLYGWGKAVESNAVDVLIHSVRKKFGQSVIRNVRGLSWTVMLGDTPKT